MSSSSSRSNNRRHSMNSIESSVTRLLVSTKHLLESLTQWARQEADDKYVSDAYVKLGNNFRAATKAFTNSGVDISDLGDVPQALRIILEAALSEAPSQENLDRFLPNIRNIIVSLLSNLKAKQAKAEAIAKSKRLVSEPPAFHGSDSTTTASSSSIPDLDSATSTAKAEYPDTQPNDASDFKKNLAVNDALTQLQKGNVLQRRASKRFSAYQFAKLTNVSHNTALPRLTQEYTSSNEDQKLPEDDEIDEIERPIMSNVDISLVNIFLKIGSKTKKAKISLPVSLASVRLLFVEKFAYSPGSSSFPDIYVQDPNSNISYELEDLEDVKDGTLLSLNDPDSQAFLIKGLDSKVQSLSAKLDLMSLEIRNQIREEVGAIEIPTPTVIATPVSDISNQKEVKSLDSSGAKKELIAIEQELKSIRQIQRVSSDQVRSIVNDLVSASKAVHDNVQSHNDSNRVYMDACHSKLSEESDILLTKVDDLQDVMEALRKDVAQRGVRVGEKQLKSTQKEIDDAKVSLQSMSEYISRERVVWKKIWESELDKVCEEQQFFNLQDDLTQDLEDDIRKIEETYKLIEKCSLEQIKQSSSKRNRVAAQLYIPEPGESLHSIKDAVLSEVAALRPNHESRVLAIERAEKLRERERELLKLNKFQEELGDFVVDNKLKKSGGIEELEKQRQLKDSENLKSSFGII
ncbi:bud site selection protein [Scheffersomyces stipitis CBS 6054]|uniref:Bud site selection protein n=1 Tax=Scheffersomyces stipitis (strain ATCC 58785 / CBS 6054 / NBRC 10063 / NRRL Y-11545) TaxID=322104 RepID=A3LPM1_PICST|nr:bud site selection protein [Scheffersomyces stipitis CBS 6054]ABN65064.2 bud site selection protein [Scheffersomyces stipitis CBS 6054]